MAIRTAVNRALTAITALPTAAALTDGNLTLLTTATASSSSTLDFTSSINSTYNSYLFKFIDIHPGTDNVEFQVNFRDGSTAYDATKTSTFFRALHDEADSTTALAYRTGGDLAQGTGFQRLNEGIGANGDQSVAGELTLFNPSSTTFVKHFMGKFSGCNAGDREDTTYVAGYCNVTAAIDGVQFKMHSGNIDAGVIKMYGVGPKQ